MAGNEAVGMAGEAFDRLPAQRHVADIVDDRERAAALQIGVVMRGIGRQHHRPARGLDLDHLQAVGMAADTMHGDAGRDLAVAGIEIDALAIDMAHHLRDVLDRERMSQQSVAHAASRRVSHLALLEMEARVREAVEIAGVVVMQMRHDNVANARRRDAEALQRIDRIERQLARPRARLLGVEAGVDQDLAALPSDQPDEIVEILRRAVMRVGRKEVHVGGARRHRRITQRVDFVGVSHGFASFLSWTFGDDRRAPSHCPQQRSNTGAAAAAASAAM